MIQGFSRLTYKKRHCEVRSNLRTIIQSETQKPICMCRDCFVPRNDDGIMLLYSASFLGLAAGFLAGAAFLTGFSTSG